MTEDARKDKEYQTLLKPILYKMLCLRNVAFRHVDQLAIDEKHGKTGTFWKDFKKQFE
jgi:hypothetical protein